MCQYRKDNNHYGRMFIAPIKEWYRSYPVTAHPLLSMQNH